MNTMRPRRNHLALLWLLSAATWTAEPASVGHTQDAANAESSPSHTGTVQAQAPDQPESFKSPEQAADALIDATDNLDVTAILRIFGPKNIDVVLSGDLAHDRERAALFAAEARKAHHIALDPKSAGRAVLLVGDQRWAFPVPIVKHGVTWSFDAPAGKQELIRRRIGNNELDAIEICRGYVDAQYEYAYKKRSGYDVNQYAQRIISSPGKQDGLAWQNADGTWGGPIGANIAHAIQLGYNVNGAPYHGYLFKILKGQGPDTPLGTMDYVVNGIMIGGFGLVASPAEYGETGVMTFIVSQDGVIYQKDLGPSTSDQFHRIERFNPDGTWNPVQVQ
jgi:hypothetical protein